MNHLKMFRRSLQAGRSIQSYLPKRLRKSSACDECLFPDKKPVEILGTASEVAGQGLGTLLLRTVLDHAEELRHPLVQVIACFDISTVSVERGNAGHAKLIKSFLYSNYWPREPSVVGLWMCLNCPYLEVLTEKYSNSGDRLLAYEFIQRTKERKLIGVSVANKTFPWMVDELEEWAHYTSSKPERNRMYFIAHCLKSPNLFNKYNVNYLYDVEILGTASEVAGQGVGTLLLRTVLDHAEELRHPLVQVIAVSQYTSKICECCGMKREWSMDFSDFIDDAGQRVFFPRRPHHTVSVYVKHFNPAEGGREPCKPPFL